MAAPTGYDDVTLEMLERSNSDAVVMVVINGPRGNGASFKIKCPRDESQARTADRMVEVAKALLKIADAIVNDAVRSKTGGGLSPDFIVRVP